MKALKKIFTDIFRVELIVLLLALLGPNVFLIWGFQANPKRVYESDFVSPIDEIKNLSGGGFAWLGHDVYIRFRSDAAVTLRDHDKFKVVPCDEMASHFYRDVHWGRKILRESEKLRCLEYDGGSVPTPNGKWLLQNIRSNHYYFRSWNHD